MATAHLFSRHGRTVRRKTHRLLVILPILIIVGGLAVWKLPNHVVSPTDMVGETVMKSNSVTQIVRAGYYDQTRLEVTDAANPVVEI